MGLRASKWDLEQDNDYIQELKTRLEAQTRWDNVSKENEMVAIGLAIAAELRQLNINMENFFTNTQVVLNDIAMSMRER